MSIWSKFTGQDMRVRAELAESNAKHIEGVIAAKAHELEGLHREAESRLKMAEGVQREAGEQMLAAQSAKTAA